MENLFSLEKCFWSISSKEAAAVNGFYMSCNWLTLNWSASDPLCHFTRKYELLQFLPISSNLIWWGLVMTEIEKKKTNLRVPHFQFATIVIINALSSSSHFWQDMRFHALQKYADALLNICFFGTQYTKHTKMNWVGWRCGVYYLNINIHRYTLYTHESCQIEFGLSTFILTIT